MNPEIAFSKDQQNIFQEGLRLFVKQVDQCIDNGKTTLGVQKSSLRNQINQSLEHINYVCHPNFGSGNLSGIPSISFYRNDLFSLLKVNREKPSLQNGVYIWFGYSYDEELYYLKFAFPNGDIDNSRCIAVNKMEQDGICNPNGKYWFEWKKNDNVFEEIPNKFLELVKYFNQFPAKDFQDNKAKENLEEAFKKFKDKLYPYNNQTSQELQHLASENKVRVLPSSKTQNSALYLLKAPYKGIKALATNSNDPFSNHISCADFLRYCDNEEITYSWAEPIFKLILKEEYENVSDFSQENTDDETLLNNTDNPLNQILYGSPGTGKTYSTIDKALEILGVNTKSKSRQELKTLFEDYKSKGQIEFVTFHQSYGYEEFVEGIKPKLSDNETNELDYKIKDGIFKTICNREREIDLNIKLWRLYTLPNADQKEDYFDECIKENFVYAYQNYGMEALEQEVKNGDYIIIPSAKSGRRSKSIRAFGILGDLIENADKNRGFRKVEWKWVAKNEKEELFFEQADFRIAPFCGVEKEKELILKTLSKQTKAPYILIIDEINRGNISKIFGELITLIEPSKRIGAEEELKVTLPYSQESFGVPSNLYIIGTMNTADRSITSLDTALRRRFEFVEMMPNPEALTNLEVYREGKDTKINLMELLQAINDRIEFLYDREKTIGHAFFLSEMQYDKDMDCYFIDFSRLKDIFQNKIIPLLQEYFYNDYEVINAVLNNNRMIEVKVDNNKQEKSKYIFKGAFKELVNNRGLDEKKIFQIAPKDPLNEDDENLWNDPQTYINIYEG